MSLFSAITLIYVFYLIRKPFFPFWKKKIKIKSFFDVALLPQHRDHLDHLFKQMDWLVHPQWRFTHTQSCCIPVLRCRSLCKEVQNVWASVRKGKLNNVEGCDRSVMSSSKQSARRRTTTSFTVKCELGVTTSANRVNPFYFTASGVNEYLFYYFIQSIFNFFYGGIDTM